MDDVLRRLGVVESLVAETRVDVSAIKATLPHLATKADVVATKADINEVRSEINALETRIIRWIVGTTIAVASVALTIAKFVKRAEGWGVLAQQSALKRQPAAHPPVARALREPARGQRVCGGLDSSARGR